MQRINQALLIQLRTQQEANEMTEAQSLQQMVGQKQQQDALKMTFQAADGYQANYNGQTCCRIVGFRGQDISILTPGDKHGHSANTLPTDVTRSTTAVSPSVDALGLHMVIALATIMMVWFGVQEALASAQGGQGFNMAKFLNFFMLITFAYCFVKFYDSTHPWDRILTARIYQAEARTTLYRSSEPTPRNQHAGHRFMRP